MTKTSTPKLIGEVIRAAHPHTGYLVRIYRYANGRKLPAPRLLVDSTDPKHVRPFAHPGVALDVLNDYRTNPRSVHVLRPDDVIRTPAKPAKAPAVLANAPRERHAKPVLAPCPPAAKRANAPRAKPKTTEELMLAFWIAIGQTPVTRVPEFVRRNLDPRRGGGTLPGHLNPLTMGEHEHA